MLPVRPSYQSFYLPPIPYCFLFCCVSLDIVQTVDYRAVWSLCISQYVYSTWVCMAVVVIIFHTNTNRYLFLFCMIDTKAGASQLLMSDQVGCSCNIAVLPKLCFLWFMHCECVMTSAYKFYRIHVFITKHALTRWARQCTLLYTHTTETYSMLPFLKFIFSSMIMSLCHKRRDYLKRLILIDGHIINIKISLRF